MPRVEMSMDGWIVETTPGARDLIGADARMGRRHFTHFVAPGTLADAAALFDIVKTGHDLDATIRIRPRSGDVIACDLHARRDGERIVAFLRLADDIPVTSEPAEVLPKLRVSPSDDVVFGRYAQRTLASIAAPTPDELAIRLRRLYPHAQVAACEEEWHVTRDRDAPRASGAWWEDASLPQVRYDQRGLILDANEAALRLISPRLVGGHWHDFVTPGSAEEVHTVIATIRSAGAAISRFRIPSADGSLIEFDSYTRVDGDVLTTVIRPVDG